jgi:hypothetical protein
MEGVAPAQTVQLRAPALHKAFRQWTRGSCTILPVKSYDSRALHRHACRPDDTRRRGANAVFRL